MADVDDNERENTEKEDLWSSILNDVTVSGANTRSSGSKNVLVLGDVCSGKSTLIDRLCLVGEANKSRRGHGSQGKFLLSGCSLEYRFIDVYDNETDDYMARMGIWNLDGVVWHSQLLPFVLNERNIHDTMVMIVADLSQPWNVIETLEKWTQVLNKHISSLKIPERKRKEMEENMVRLFQTYQDPEEQKTSGSVLSGEGDDVVLPLDENILSCNMGIPTIVVCTKSDHYVQLEKNHSYKDEHFDFIQQHIRRFCLSYGAGLVYTSTKDNRNITLLYDYLLHKAYNLKFAISASVLEREGVFIPSGWDSEQRIAVVCDQMKHINPREPLKNVIVPSRITMPLSDTESVAAEDDQTLLLALQAYLSKAPKASTSAPTTTTTTQKERSPRPSINTSESTDTPTKQPSGPAGSSGVGGAGGGAGEQVLATFFNSLLTKNKGVSKGGKIPELDKLRQRSDK